MMQTILMQDVAAIVATVSVVLSFIAGYSLKGRADEARAEWTAYACGGRVDHARYGHGRR